MPILGIITTILSKNKIKNTKNSLFLLTFGGVSHLQPIFNHFFNHFSTNLGYIWLGYIFLYVFYYTIYMLQPVFQPLSSQFGVQIQGTYFLALDKSSNIAIPLILIITLMVQIWKTNAMRLYRYENIYLSIHSVLGLTLTSGDIMIHNYT